MVSYVLVQLWDDGNIINRGGSDYESEAGFVCSLIVLIRYMAADVVISTAGAMPGDGRQRADEQKFKNIGRSKNNQLAPERFRMVFV